MHRGSSSARLAELDPWDPELHPQYLTTKCQNNSGILAILHFHFISRRLIIIHESHKFKSKLSTAGIIRAGIDIPN